MKKSINYHSFIRIGLQSLPVLLAAIAILIYAVTLLPLSTKRMKQCVVLVECTSHYELCANGKPVARFTNFDDSLALINIAPTADTSVYNSQLFTGVWINRYAFFPSCHGRVLVPTADSTANAALKRANNNIATVTQRAISSTENHISQLKNKSSKLLYYLNTHNVTDDGYNTMAAYAANNDTCLAIASKLLKQLQTLNNAKSVSIRRIAKYTLLYNNKGKTERNACTDITQSSSSRFRIVQANDHKTPHDATALYFHQWFSPTLHRGNNIFTVAFFGSEVPNFSTKKLSSMPFPCTMSTKKLSSMPFPCTMTTDTTHNAPSLLAPTGCPVFNSSNRLAGININGKVIPISSFHFGFNDLLK